MVPSPCRHKNSCRAKLQLNMGQKRRVTAQGAQFMNPCMVQPERSVHLSGGRQVSVASDQA